MKIRESGMPGENYWDTFFDVPLIFDKLQITSSINNLAEFGSGYGTFTVPATKIVKGIVHAFDIDETMIDSLNIKIEKEKIHNIKVHCIDFVKETTRLNDESVDYVMLFNILHAEQPVELLKEAKRILSPGGKVGIIHWIYSDKTPRGPSMNIRPKPENIIGWLTQTGFKTISEIIDLPPFHYGIVATK